MKKYKKVIVYLVVIIISVFFTGCNDNTIQDEIHIHISDDKNSSSTEKTSVAKNSATVTTIITTTVNITEQVLNEASLYAEKGNYIPAIDCIHNAQKTYGDNDAYSEALENYYVSYKVLSINAANDLAINDDYLQAIKVINKTSEIIGSNDELTAKITDYENSYALSVISSADEAVSSMDYDKATKIIEDAMKQISDNALLTNKLNEINSKKPVPLDTMKPFNDGWTWNNVPSPVLDPFEETDYSTAKNYFVLQECFYASAEYYSNFKYSSLTFSISPYINMGKDEQAYVVIYINGNEEAPIFTSPAIARKSKNQTFEVDISEAEYFTIILKDDYPYGGIILSDVMLLPAEE